MGWVRGLILASGIGYYFWRFRRSYRQLLEGKSISHMHLVSSPLPVMSDKPTDPWLGECPRGLVLIISEQVNWDIEGINYPQWVERYYHQSIPFPIRPEINRPLI